MFATTIRTHYSTVASELYDVKPGGGSCDTAYEAWWEQVSATARNIMQFDPDFNRVRFYLYCLRGW